MTTFTIRYGTERFTYHMPKFMAQSLRSQYKFNRGLDIKHPRGSTRDSRRANRDAVAHHLLVAMSTFGADWSQDALVSA